MLDVISVLSASSVQKKTLLTQELLMGAQNRNLCYNQNMRKIDGRKLSTEAQQQMRYTAVELCRGGDTYASVSRTLGVVPSSVRKWDRLYKQGGYDSLIIRKRGVKPGINSKLHLEQIRTLGKVLVENTPDQIGLNFVLWTRQAIQNLILKLWNVTVCLVTVGRYMRRLSFTPQKPIKRAYEQDPKAVTKWLNETYPMVAKTALEQEAEIHWLDETKLSNYSNYLRGYSPKGKTPIIRMKSKRLALNIISSISKLGKMRFMTYKHSLNTKTLITFANRLCKDIHKKVFIILDNLAVHHSKKFMHWLDEHKNRIKVFYLPTYSPELNPDERLNRNLKTHFHSGLTAKDEKELKNKILSYMKSIQKTPSRIFNYFSSKDVRYAA